MERLKSVERALGRAEGAVLCVLVAFMVGLSFVQVVLRQAGRLTGLSLSLLWGDTLLRHLVLWVAFLGACIAAAADKQFAMDATARLFEGRSRARVRLVCHAFAALVSAFLLKAAAVFFKAEYSNRAILFAVGRHEVPAWLFEAIIPAGFALLLVHYLLKAAQAAADRALSRGSAASGGRRGAADRALSRGSAASGGRRGAAEAR